MRTTESELKKIYEGMDLQDAEAMAARNQAFKLLEHINRGLPDHYKQVAYCLMLISEYQSQIASGKIEPDDKIRNLRDWKESNVNLKFLLTDLESIENFFIEFGHLTGSSWQNL